MDQSTGHASTAIFAADGSARHRMVRVAVAGGAALLAAWLIALALGVLGGFDSLPGLPGKEATGSNEASSRAHQAAPQSRPPKARQASPKTVTTSPVTDSASPTQQQQASTPKTKVTQAAPQPSTPATTTSTGHGQSDLHATTTTGKPVGSPGNGAGGSGAPGQFR